MGGRAGGSKLPNQQLFPLCLGFMNCSIKEVNFCVAQSIVGDMMFNLGYSGLAGFVNMKECVDAQDYDCAADEMEDSAWCDQVDQPTSSNLCRLNQGDSIYDVCKTGLHFHPCLLLVEAMLVMHHPRPRRLFNHGGITRWRGGIRIFHQEILCTEVNLATWWHGDSLVKEPSKLTKHGFSNNFINYYVQISPGSLSTFVFFSQAKLPAYMMRTSYMATPEAN